MGMAHMRVFLNTQNKVNEVIKYHEEVSIFVKQKGLAMYFPQRAVFIWNQRGSKLDAKPSFEH